MGKGGEMGLGTLAWPRITCLPEAPCSFIGSREDLGPRPFLYEFESTVVVITFSLLDHVPAQNLAVLLGWYFLCVHILIQEAPTMLFPASPKRPETPRAEGRETPQHWLGKDANNYFPSFRF